MVIEPPDRPDLAARLSQAIKSYKAGWKPVDSELYDLCGRRSSQSDLADVYTKVAMIGRVYEAGVARSWRGDGDPETEVTRVLIEQADLIQAGLQHLQMRRFDQQTAGAIVELHGHIARAISHRSGGIFLASFVSKYLHFHCPIVPIYDSNAQDAIGKLVDRKLVDPIRDAMAELPEWARAYRNFVAAFVVLYEWAYAETSLKPTVKELDHLLCSPDEPSRRAQLGQRCLHRGRSAGVRGGSPRYGVVGRPEPVLGAGLTVWPDLDSAVPGHRPPLFTRALLKFRLVRHGFRVGPQVRRGISLGPAKSSLLPQECATRYCE